ncbi:hypothetical protein [Bacillus infantis]|uniref:hypothetical protein n=1 Tax=Bacillus infantis TaxID=324767 RepID=UPI003B9688EF
MTSTKDLSKKEQLIEEITKRRPQVKSILQNIKGKKHCGVGTIGLWLADQAGEVRGMETSSQNPFRTPRKKSPATRSNTPNTKQARPCCYIYISVVFGL